MFTKLSIVSSLALSLVISNSAIGTSLRHESSKDIAIAHTDFPKSEWLNSEQRVELFRNEERASTAPTSTLEGAKIMWWNLWVNAVPVIVSVAGYAISSLLVGRTAPAALANAAPAQEGNAAPAAAVNAAVAAGAAGAGIGAFFLQKQMSDMVDAGKKVLNYQLQPVDALKLLKTNLFANSVKLVEHLPASLREKVLTIDRDISAALNIGDTGTAGKMLLAREKVFLAMPLHTHPIDSHASPEIAAMFKRVIDRTLPENHATLRGLIHAMEDNSRLSLNHELADGTPAAGIKTVIFLNGPRGTGKTEFVRDLTAAAGFKDACMIKLAELESANELLGTGFYWGEGATEKVYGRIVKCFLESGVLNPIIFFEEASNSIGAEPRRTLMNQSAGEVNGAFKKLAFLETFKTLFEKDATSAAFRLQGLMGAPFDLSRATYILAGNFPLHKDLSSGGRVTNVYFGPLNPEQKRNAANDTLKAQLSSLEDRPKDFGMIKGIFNDKVIQYIISKDENRFIPGARILKSVFQKAITHVKHTGSIGEAELKQFIGHTFVAEDKRDLAERKNDALAIAFSRQERRLGAGIHFQGRELSHLEIARIVEIMREAQEQILISANENLPAPQAIATNIEMLCDYVTSEVALRDREKYGDDEIETFAIPEHEFMTFLTSLFGPPPKQAQGATQVPPAHMTRGAPEPTQQPAE